MVWAREVRGIGCAVFKRGKEVCAILFETRKLLGKTFRMKYSKLGRQIVARAMPALGGISSIISSEKRLALQPSVGKSRPQEEALPLHV